MSGTKIYSSQDSIVEELRNLFYIGHSDIIEYIKEENDGNTRHLTIKIKERKEEV